MKKILIIWWLSDKYYLKVIENIRKWNVVIIVDNLESWCLKNLRLIMNDIGFPPKFYEVDYFDDIEMEKIYKKHKFDEEFNYIKNHNMKILTLGLWAFGFAVNKLLWENNPEKTFYAFELNNEIVSSIKKDRTHPFFFEGYKLPENIEVLDSYEKIIAEVDVIILAMPAQFIQKSVESFASKLKEWVTILNLAKWIDIKNNKTISQLLSDTLSWINYNYAVLSWWMIAAEVVEWQELWADLGISNDNIWSILKWYLESNKFHVEQRSDILNIELYGSLKNIMAIIVWIEEWKGNNASTVGYKLTKFYSEMKEIIWEYGWNKEIDFWYYSLWWDIVATCFWWSRNRYLWHLIWWWMETMEAIQKLRDEKKHAEGYETLKAVYEKIKDKEWFSITKELYNKLY